MSHFIHDAPGFQVSAMRLLTIHPTNNTQLAEVVQKMRVVGAPTIRVVDCADHYFAIEGTHRIEAARLMSIPVTLEVIRGSALLDVRGMDIEINWTDVPTKAIAAKEVVAQLRAECNGDYQIFSDGMVILVRAAKYPPVPPL